MTLPPVSPSRARSLVDRFPGVKVLLVGDAMLDHFIIGHVSRISPEAPVPVVRFESELFRLGGAANVAHNIVALGGAVDLISVAGHDSAANRMRGLLVAAGIGCDGLVDDRSRPTTEKVRIVTSRHQQVARVDYEDDRDIDLAVEGAIIDQIDRRSRPQAILVSDYLKGAITQGVMRRLVEASETGTPLLVDPKIPHLAMYAGATLITPNHHEAEVATHLRIRTHDEAHEAAQAFRRRAVCDAVLITRGERGMWLSSPEGEGSIPAIAREVADVTGAGDTVVATLALAMAAGATLPEAAVLANHAAGIVVARFGPATASPEELIASFGQA